MDTIIPQTGAMYGFMATGSKVRVCGHGLQSGLHDNKIASAAFLYDKLAM